MTKGSARTVIGGFCLALVLSLLSIAPAGASTASPPVLPDPLGDTVVPVLLPATPLAAGIRWIEGALAAREKALTLLSSTVATAPLANTSDRATIVSLVASSSLGITTLETTAKSAISIAEVNTDISEMIVNFRVFSILRPEVNLILRIELRLKSLHAIVAVEPGLQAAISTEKSIGLNTAAIERRFTALSSSTAVLGTELAGFETTLFGVTPANYPATTTFSDTSTTLSGVPVRLQKLEAKVRGIVESLSQLRAEKADSKHQAKALLSSIFARISSSLADL